jgi:hypothetical protein
LQGLKPDVDLIGFIGTTKVMPCYRALEIEVWASFSATCKARFIRGLCGTTKVVPFQNIRLFGGLPSGRAAFCIFYSTLPIQ